MIDYYFYKGRKKTLLNLIDLPGRFIKKLTGARFNEPVDPASVKRILFVNSTHLGDNLLSTPLLAGIKEHFREASITYLTKKWSADAVRNNPAINVLMEYNAPWSCNPGQKPHTYRELLRIAGHLRKERFDLAVVTQFDPRNIIFARLCGVKYCAGISNNGFSFLLTHKTDIEDFGKHMVEYNLDLLRSLGGNPADKKLRFFVPEAEAKTAEDKWNSNTQKGGINVIIHPGSGHPARSWDLKKFSGLCSLLSEKNGINVMIAGGSGDEQKAEEIIKGCRPGIRNLCSKLTLAELACFLRKADAVLVQDSGIMHLAAAVDAHIIALFGPSDEKTWGPYKTGRIIKGDCPLYPCANYKRCEYSSLWSCMKDIPLEKVYKAVLETIDSRLVYT